MNFVNNQSNIRQVISLKKSKNIIQYKKSFNINIGVIIFIIIFIYLIFNIFSYLTETHISVYEVEQGTIAVNNVYHGLILRDEKLFPSIYNGSLNYYVKEGSKIAYGDLIYSVDETGNVASIINEANKNGANLDKDSLNEIEESISDFQSSYRSGNFYQVYSFKENINDSLSEALSVGALNEISDYLSNANDLSTFHKVYADANGIIVYYTDGLETVTTDNFTEDMFNEAAYQKANLKSGNTITSGCTAYKLIDSEYWNIVIPIPESTASLLNDDDTIRIRFLKDDKETYATYSITEKNGQQYLEICEFLAENHITKSDIIVALGGGVVGDLSGFVAATFLRGISFVQIPTTLLAAVDSSVGGKTAIDLKNGKNLVGSFYQPKLVICDYLTLNTLEKNIFVDGCAEVIKYDMKMHKALEILRDSNK